MSKMTARRLWLNVHLYLALTLGLVLVVVAVSGALLVWHDSVDRMIDPQRYATSGTEVTKTPEEYLRIGTSALGAVAPTTIRMPQEPGDPITVAGPIPSVGGGRPPMMTAWIDPQTGLVLDVANSSKSFTRWLHVLHGRLFIPEIGRQVVGWTGVFMLILSFSGIYLWWPRGIKFSRALNWRKGVKTTTNLHHVAGIWISIPLAIVSLTGVYISFPQTARAVLGTFVELEPQAPGGGRPNRGPAGDPLQTTMFSLDQAVEKAQTMRPDAALVAVSLPTTRESAWQVQFKGAEGQPNDRVKVNDHTGDVVLEPQRKPETAQATQRLMRQIHDGTDMGIVWQIFVFLTGVLPALFMVTGVIMWLRRRSFEKDRKLKRAAAAAARSA